MHRYILSLIIILVPLSILAQPYVGSKKSDKYHYTTCRWAKKINPENIVSFETIKDAEEAGDVASKVCRPRPKSKIEEPKKKEKKKKDDSYVGRCQATTKKGTQCKRNAKKGSKYCWQHQR
jgi:methylphosphotriester-DNA--protein-cysteine methyltransferase